MLIDVNPIIGVGFESFWLGSRVYALWEKYWWHPNQAHNGYFEMYLNLGLLGLLSLASMIVSGYRNARKEMLSGAAENGQNQDAALRRSQAYYKLAFLLGLLLFNLTDATFKAVHLAFFVFFVVASTYPYPAATSALQEQPGAAKPRRLRRALTRRAVAQPRRAVIARPRGSARR
jgi:O-antigen ligase